MKLADKEFFKLVLLGSLFSADYFPPLCDHVTIELRKDYNNQLNKIIGASKRKD